MSRKELLEIARTVENIFANAGLDFERLRAPSAAELFIDLLGRAGYRIVPKED